MKTVRLGCTDIGAILFAGIDDDNNLCSTYISVGGDKQLIPVLLAGIKQFKSAY